METKDITANNEMIALFMGAKHVAANLYSYLSAENSPLPNKGTQYNSPYMQYHQDWNWLMPVCKKILFENDLEATLKGDLLESMTSAFHNVDIEELYNAVVEFIKWFNQNK